MGNRLLPEGYEPDRDIRERFAGAVEQYLDGEGDAVLDVANPLGQPSLFRGDAEAIKSLDGDYVAVNPTQSEGTYEGVSYRAADGLSRSREQDGVPGIDDVVREESLDEPLYMVVHGMTQLLSYFVRDREHVDPTADRETRHREAATTFAKNVSDMAVDTLLIADGVDTWSEGYAISTNDLPEQLYDRLVDDLEDYGWDVSVYDGEHDRAIAARQR